jgi:non-ribosomal peptide synthetase-like protein
MLLPAVILAAALVMVMTLSTLSYYHLHWLAGLMVMPFISLVASLSVVVLSASTKALIIGRFRPVVQPLWSPFVWANEVVNGVYESTCAVALTPLMGTPFIAPCLRAMGCKIGRWVFCETTLFSEFDLVEIGDHAALNFGVTLQTHLFEDRIMKAERLRIGDHCSVGNMSVVLYGSEMQEGSCLGPLSLLMKGETLPARSRWQGIPTQATYPLGDRSSVLMA